MALLISVGPVFQSQKSTKAKHFWIKYNSKLRWKSNTALIKDKAMIRMIKIRKLSLRSGKLILGKWLLNHQTTGSGIINREIWFQVP